MEQEEMMSSVIPKIRVVIRKRPLSKKEALRNEVDIIEKRSSQEIIVKELKNKVDLTKYIEEHQFVFDQVFDETVSNQELYVESVQPLVEAAFNGAKVTCFAYGQTGSGKTHTMMGPPNPERAEDQGMYSLAAADIFYNIQSAGFNHLTVIASFYEIYCGKLYDLLKKKAPVHCREDAKGRVCIQNLSEHPVYNVEELFQLMAIGLDCRTTGQTGANIDSSRSHAILQLALKENQKKVFGKLSFIDLAGSERGADTIDTNKQTRMDGAQINKSLLALKECIRALDQTKKHTPFRGSKLTQVLKDSFTGNCRTTMIGNISPSASCCEHTLNTLRYADRVKELKRSCSAPRTPGASNTENNSLAQILMLPRQGQNSQKVQVTSSGNPYDSTQRTTSQSMNSGASHSQPRLQRLNSIPTPQPYPQHNYVETQPQPLPSPQPQLQPQLTQQRSTGIPSVTKGVKPKNQFGFTQGGKQMIPRGTPSSGMQIQSQNYQKLTDNLKNISNFINNGAGSSRSQGSSNPKGKQNGSFENERQGMQHQLAVKTETELYRIRQDHDNLIAAIVQQEQELINDHRQHIDTMVEVTKEEMRVLNEVESPESDVETYVQTLENILAHKVSEIEKLRSRLHHFQGKLQQEKQLSQRFQDHQAEVMDVFDLNSAEQIQDIELLDGLNDMVS